jgi:hypothetical protein
MSSRTLVCRHPRSPTTWRSCEASRRLASAPCGRRTGRKTTAGRPLRPGCGHRSHRTAANPGEQAPHEPSVFGGVFARVRWLSQIFGKSGRQVQVGFPEPFGGLLRSICGRRNPIHLTRCLDKRRVTRQLVIRCASRRRLESTASQTRTCSTRSATPHPAVATR